MEKIPLVPQTEATIMRTASLEFLYNIARVMDQMILWRPENEEAPLLAYTFGLFIPVNLYFVGEKGDGMGVTGTCRNLS
jgi:hypothetical protein